MRMLIAVLTRLDEGLHFGSMKKAHPKHVHSLKKADEEAAAATATAAAGVKRE